MIRLDFQKGKTLVTLGEFPTTRPRKLRRACKGLRRALGVGSDVVIEVIVRKAGDLTPVAAADSATIDREAFFRPEPGTVPSRGYDGPAEPAKAPAVDRWPLSPAAVNLAAAGPDGPTVVTLRTYGDLSKFIRDFTGPTSTVPAGRSTVKDLVRQLDASSYGDVSAAIHKIGFSLSAKVDFFVAYLEESPAKAIPERSTP